MRSKRVTPVLGIAVLIAATSMTTSACAGPDPNAFCPENPSYAILLEGGMEAPLPTSDNGVNADFEVTFVVPAGNPPFAYVAWYVDPAPEDGSVADGSAMVYPGDIIDIQTYGSVEITGVCEGGVTLELLGEEAGADPDAPEGEEADADPGDLEGEESDADTEEPGGEESDTDPGAPEGEETDADTEAPE